jgi:hypothetical protein
MPEGGLDNPYIDSNRGLVLLATANCVGDGTGAIFTAGRTDSVSSVFYAEGSIPTVALTSTTESGSGGFINYRPGEAIITIKSAETGADVKNLNLFVRAGHLTQARQELPRQPGNEPAGDAGAEEAPQ